MIQINRVAVLGAGVMGATIAAHLANAGLEILLLDIVPSELNDEEKLAGLTLENPLVRNRLAMQGLKGLQKMKPAPMYLREYGDQIEVGNLEDDLPKLKDCDWVIEVVVEYMGIKLDLLSKITPHLSSHSIITTNTSGLSVNEMASALPQEIQKRFLATHFFNPPRYMRLMEIIPCQYSDPKIVDELCEFISRRLGKGIVFAKDTTNFIANRIGTYAIYKGIEHMVDMEMTVEEVDAIAGPATARPKSGAFRTADLVGLDTLAHVGTQSYELLKDDEEKDVFKLPGFMKEMIDKGLLGNKTKQGFYKKEMVDGKKAIFFYDYKSGEFLPLEKPKFSSVMNVKQVDDPRKRLQMVVNGADKAALYAWKTIRDTLLYAFNRIPEIADDIVNIDNAMRWGFNWEIGPFEMFDSIGVQNFIARAEKEGVTISQQLKEVESFYRFNDNGDKEYFDIVAKDYKPVVVKESEIHLEILKKKEGVVDKNSSCSLIDIGDGVYCLQFHSKMNSISGDILTMTTKAVQRAEREGIGLVVGNHGANFSVGANLMLMAVALAEGALEDIDMYVRMFQKAAMSFKYSKVPVVCAPFNMTLGGAAEYCLHADAIVGYAETYMGLVEIGVGLLPAGGGTKEMALRAIEASQKYGTDVQPFLIKNFKQIAMAKVSTGAQELYPMGYMRHGDTVTMNLDKLLGDAKKKVISLAANYRPKKPVNKIPAPGRGVAAAIKSQLWNMQAGKYITEYEAEMGGVIASVMCGGDVSGSTRISEDYYLQLEREGFLKLCGNPKTGQRIQHMLKTGKPLRN